MPHAASKRRGHTETKHESVRKKSASLLQKSVQAQALYNPANSGRRSTSQHPSNMHHPSACAEDVCQQSTSIGAMDVLKHGPHAPLISRLTCVATGCINGCMSSCAGHVKPQQTQEALPATFHVPLACSKQHHCQCWNLQAVLVHMPTNNQT